LFFDIVRLIIEFTNSSEDTLDVFKQILEDMDERSEKTQSHVGKIIFIHIRNLMSDRAATQLKFNRLLEIHVNEVIPVLMKARGILEPEDYSLLVTYNEVFCGIHSLVHMANLACATSSKMEEENFGGQVPILNPTMRQSGESGAARTIRTACKGDFHS
jgi:hypothetical protein